MSMNRHFYVAAFVAGLLGGCTSPETSPAAKPAIPLEAQVQEGPPPAAPTIDIAYLTKKPAAIFEVQPEYPLAMRKKHIQGTVVVDFIVGTDGLVYRAKAVRSTNDDFATSAVIAVSRWRFRPGLKDGELVNTHLQVPIAFTLADDHDRPARTHARLPADAAIYAPEQVSRQPLVRQQVSPVYPTDMRRAGITGKVITEFVVTSDGFVANAHTVSATNPEFADAALACIENWRYRPAVRDGNPVNCRVQVPIVFTLNDE